MIAISSTKNRTPKSIVGRINGEANLKGFNCLLRRLHLLQNEELVEGLTVVIKSRKLFRGIRIVIDNEDAIKFVNIHLDTLLSMQRDKAIGSITATVSFIHFFSFRWLDE